MTSMEFARLARFVGLALFVGGIVAALFTLTGCSGPWPGGDFDLEFHTGTLARPGPVANCLTGDGQVIGPLTGGINLDAQLRGTWYACRGELDGTVTGRWVNGAPEPVLEINASGRKITLRDCAEEAAGAWTCTADGANLDGLPVLLLPHRGGKAMPICEPAVRDCPP